MPAKKYNFATEPLLATDLPQQQSHHPHDQETPEQHARDLQEGEFLARVWSVLIINGTGGLELGIHLQDSVLGLIDNIAALRNNRVVTKSCFSFIPDQVRPLC